MPQRIFDGPFQYGEMCVYPNTLIGVGSRVDLHAHEFPHMALFWPGKNNDARYRVWAKRTDGTEVELELGDWNFVYIAAKVDHRIELIAGEEGRFACIFSLYGPDGFRPEPLLDHVKCVEEQV